MSRLALSLAALFSLVPLACFSAEGNKIFTQKPEVISAQTAGNAALVTAEAMPSWVWGTDQKKNYLIRKKFTGGGVSAKLLADCDNMMTLYINDQKIARHENWAETVDMDIQKYLHPGENILLAEVENVDDVAGYVFHITITDAAGKKQFVLSDATCEVAESKDKPNWQPATVVAKYGSDPWGSVFDTKGLEADERQFGVANGFQLERLYSVPKNDLGSWVCIALDNKGRIIASDQGLERKYPGEGDPFLTTHGLCRITPPPIGSSEPTKVEHLAVEMTSAQGLLWAFDSLYVSVNGKNSGLYRLRDTDGDDQFDEVKQLASFRGAGEHGPHALRLSPDGKSIYIVCGNHTKLPFDLVPKDGVSPQTMGGIRPNQMRADLPENCTSRVPPNWDEDAIVPRQWDANGHAAGILAPGGWICKTDPDGKTWEVFSAGYRNTYDFDFDQNGEMFAYDSDMEWDMGAPWYRATRIVHATSGSDFGWRSGTCNMPAYYADSMPPILDIGPGSPVGVAFGYGTKFPAKYQKALFALDWTFATIYAIHLTPKGSSFTAEREEFLWGKPLPLTDCVIGKDGALYFTVGGRNTQSELFRVTYVGKESTAPIAAAAPVSKEVEQRHSLEKFHVAGANPSELELTQLVKSLAHEDLAIRYAARVALERVPVDRWQEAALKIPVPRGIIAAVIALAHQAEPALQPKLLEALGKLDYQSLGEEDRLSVLRAYQLVLVRLGLPPDDVRIALGKKFTALFPAKTDFENRELAGLLVALRSVDAASKIVPLMTRPSVQNPPDWGVALSRNERYGKTIRDMIANFPDLQQIHYAYVLRNLTEGWTYDQRKQYFEWFNRARDWNGGASFRKFLVNIENDAYKLLPEKDRLLLDAAGVRKAFVAKALPKPVGPGKDYSVDDLVNMWEGSKGKVRNFRNGKTMFSAARCIVCHRFGGEGGATGPDLSLVSGRFSPRDMGESIVLPSKVISDQYKTMIFALSDGSTKTGRLISETNGTVTLLTDPEDATKTVEFKRADVETSKPSPTSMMPEGLLKTLNEEEVLDLYAYLLSGGNDRDLMFRRPR